MSDPFQGMSQGMTGPAHRAFAIQPNDAADLPSVTRGVYVGSGGGLSVVLAGDMAAVTFANIPPGLFLPIRAKRVRATGTTAGNLIGLL